MVSFLLPVLGLGVQLVGADVLLLVSGGGDRLRGQSLRAQTTLVSATYRVASACRYSQAIRPSTTPMVDPYSDRLCASWWVT